MARYIIGVKRTSWNSVKPTWIDTLRNIKGVEIIGENERRATIEMNPTLLKEVESTLGNNFIVEEEIPHRPANEPTDIEDQLFHCGFHGMKSGNEKRR